MPAATEAVWVVTVEEAARLIGKHPKTVYRWLKEGWLPARRVGGSWLIPRRELSLFIGNYSCQHEP